MATVLVASAAWRADAAEDGMRLPSFVEALETNKAMVYSIAWHFLRNRGLAEELAQDVFLELHRNWRSMKSPEHIVFWLRKVVSRRAIDAIRKKRTRPEARLDESAEPTALESVQDCMLSSYLERIVASLPEKHRLLIVLRYQEGMEPQEIAELLGMNANTVKTQLGRTLDLLRAKTAHRLRPESEGIN